MPPDPACGQDPGFGVFHAGELQAQQRYGAGRLTRGLAATVRDRLNPALIRFLLAQPFCFIATASDQGACDCSFRGRQHHPPNDPEPLLAIPDEHTLILPDYPGNQFFNSIGNLLTNPHIGLLFIDFASATRVRINGTARVHDDTGDHWQTWPAAERLIEVSVQQAYPNCRARIPRLVPG
ncbi:MAG: pyridoxamine 5'-phosphate oxidase family protein [Pseudomonadota bacterium]|nr:pyridoxamine 5'-phosphate oxidase family protein [Pseudomonadota bacterium]